MVMVLMIFSINGSIHLICATQKLNPMYRKNFLSAVFSLVLVTFSLVSAAQMGERQEQHRQMEARRIAFLTAELELSPAEAQVFWPVYNEFNRKRDEMMVRHRTARNRLAELDQLTDAQLLELADMEIANMEEMTALRRQYHERFKEILPLRKVVKLYEAERNFNRNLLRESRGAQRGRGRN